MKCEKCSKKAAIDINYLPKLCKVCFCRLIEKRIRKFTRINQVFKRNDKVITVGDVCNYFVKSIAKDLPMAVKNVKTMPKPRKGFKILAPWTLDDENNQFLEFLFLNKKPQKQSFIKLLLPVTDQETALFAKIKKLNFKPNKKNPAITNFIEKLQEKYPEVKFSLLKSLAEHKRILES